jgi:hypothetical protein
MDESLTDPPFDGSRSARLAARWPAGAHAIPPPRLFAATADGVSPGATPEAIGWHREAASLLASDRQELPILTLAAHEVWLGDTHVTSVPPVVAPIDRERRDPFWYSWNDYSLSSMLQDLARQRGPVVGQELGAKLTGDTSWLTKFEALYRAPLADLRAVFSGRGAPAVGTNSPWNRGIRVLVPGDTPFQTWLALVNTATGAEFNRYFLLTEGTALSPGPGAIRWGVGSWGHSHCMPVKTMQIDLLVLPEGVALRTDEGPVGPGCSTGEGLTFPRETATPRDLADCVHKLDDARPEVRHYHNAIWADPALPVHRLYETLLLLQPLLRTRHDSEDHDSDLGMAPFMDGLFSDYPRLIASPAPVSVEEWQRHPVLSTDQGVLLRGRQLGPPFSLEEWRRERRLSQGVIDHLLGSATLDAAVLGVGSLTRPPPRRVEPPARLSMSSRSASFRGVPDGCREGWSRRARGFPCHQGRGIAPRDEAPRAGPQPTGKAACWRPRRLRATIPHPTRWARTRRVPSCIRRGWGRRGGRGAGATWATWATWGGRTMVRPCGGMGVGEPHGPHDPAIAQGRTVVRPLSPTTPWTPPRRAPAAAILTHRGRRPDHTTDVGGTMGLSGA